MTDALHNSLPADLWALATAARLPGVQPARPGSWARVDDAYGAQMALRDTLLQTRPDKVLAVLPGAEPAGSELLECALAQTDSLPGFARVTAGLRRPDGKTLSLDRANPMHTLGRLFQQDFCILEKQGGRHRLVSAVLCFPASWTLGEKIGKPLLDIHKPVPGYTEDIALRVQRLFDNVRPDTPLERANMLRYDDPALFQPRPEGAPHAPGDAARYVRSERQTIFRLPHCGAVVFAIHSHVVGVESLTKQQRADLDALGRV